MGGVPQPTSAMIFRQKYIFTRLLSCLKNCTSLEADPGILPTAICNNNLGLKAVYYSILKRKFILNVVGRGPRLAFDYNGIS